jgi:hypothetical protein
MVRVKLPRRTPAPTHLPANAADERAVALIQVADIA